MSVHVYVPGEILTAANLNASFDSKADGTNTSIDGGVIQNIDKISIVGAYPSTTPTTGALTVVGGVGIQGDTHTAGLIVSQNNTPSTSKTTGALVILGGAGISGDVYLGSNLSVAGQLNTSGPAGFADSTASTTPGTGAVVVTGGVGVGGALNVGGAVKSGGVITTTNATASTTPANGALVVSGGAGIGGDINAGGNIGVGGTIDVTGVATFHAAVNLPGAPGGVNEAANKGYVDLVAGSVASAAVQKAGDTMTGPLVLSGDPTAALGAATRQYADATAITYAIALG
jgi:hypothetical protein